MVINSFSIVLEKILYFSYRKILDIIFFMKYLDYSVNTGAKNMEIDSQLLDEAISSGASEPIFRFYGWSPSCISLGKNQKDDFVDKEYLSQIGVDCVRRQTGGRALFHDNELTYSYVTPVSVVPNGENVTKSYEYISQILIDVFNHLGITLTIGGCPRHISKNNYCMSVSTGADLCWNGRKFIGSAQFRKSGYILQHGSILFDYDKDLILKLFNEPTEFETIVTLREINSNVTIEDVINAFKKISL